MNGTMKFHAELDCSACGNRAEHELSYAGRILATTRCLQCGHLERHEQGQLRADYLADLSQRIVSKPVRMARRLQRHPVRFLMAMPLSVARKPIRMITEVRHILLGPDRK
jgi:hypothetical protein